MEYDTIIGPFRIKMVEPISMTTEKKQEGYLKKAHFNTLLLSSDQVMIDFLTDRTSNFQLLTSTILATKKW